MVISINCTLFNILMSSIQSNAVCLNEQKKDTTAWLVVFIGIKI